MSESGIQHCAPLGDKTLRHLALGMLEGFALEIPRAKSTFNDRLHAVSK